MASAFVKVLRCFVLASAVLSVGAASSILRINSEIDRCSFPQHFVFGSASAAYQFEGAVHEGGRKASIWDIFTHESPEKILDHSNGDIAADQYHRYKEDVQLIKNMNMDAYRFSIAWARLYPDGDGALNLEAVDHYNALIDALLASGIEPYVTMYHWDLPQALENSIDGWLSPEIVDKFAAYARTCFDLFGDRVKHWMTFNEPSTFITQGYSFGKHAPGRCSRCSKGNSATDPYLAAHHVILAHAAAFQIYKHEYQAHQGGKLGIALDCWWYEPYTNSSEDVTASHRSIDFKIGWFLSPLSHGDYPQSMRENVASRLPVFTPKQKDDIRNSYDFLGLNHYTSTYVRNDPVPPDNNVTTTDTDWRVLQTVDRNGVPIGPKAASDWLRVVPWGFQKILKYIQERYNPPTIIVTENGTDEPNDSSLTLEQALKDDHRIEYYRSYLHYLLAAMREGVNISGYFAWSMLDNFEWDIGYTVRFGLNYVDYSNLKRYPKMSALWFKQVLANSACKDSEYISSI